MEVVNEKVLQKTIQRCRERDIIIPTYEQMKHPKELVPAKIQEELKGIGLWDLHPRNLFRLTWKNDVKTGGFGDVNYVEIPRELTGVKARIFALTGKFFPTGAHKVGATFGPLVSRLVTGQFDPTSQKAVWPSTGNYCRGGAYDSALLACESVAILPEEMSQERFNWLKSIGAEIIATPGCESNVKEIFDKCWELKARRGDEIVVLNQFSEFGNAIWHYEVTGSAIEEVLSSVMGSKDRFSALPLTTGSAGTIGSGNYLRKVFPRMRVVAGEAWQCPTMLMNGFGGHRIEGIGDKHVPWIHDIRNTDAIGAVDDEHTIRLIRLFNEPAGREFLKKQGVPADFMDKLDLMGISSVGNMLLSIMTAKYFEMDEHDVIFTIFTDSMEMYQSRLDEMNRNLGEYNSVQAEVDFNVCLKNIQPDHYAELTHWDRKRVHNLKYYTWIEQQDKKLEELNRQWFDREYWEQEMGQASLWDDEIDAFNDRVGLLKKYTG